MNLENGKHPPKNYDPLVKLSLEDARAAGATVYWTGVACSRGHIAHRYISNKNCVLCARANRTSFARRGSMLEAAQRGIDLDKRRDIEAKQEELRLLRELNGYEA